MSQELSQWDQQSLMRYNMAVQLVAELQDFEKCTTPLAKPSSSFSVTQISTRVISPYISNRALFISNAFPEDDVDKLTKVQDTLSIVDGNTDRATA